MLKLSAFCLGLALALPSFAQVAPVSGERPTATKGDPDRKICQRIELTSSRIPWRTICKTAREWDYESGQQRQSFERAQRAVNQQPSKPMAPVRPGCCSS
jgi:hypothetical protein